MKARFPLISLVLASAASAVAQIPAFPGAEGFGSHAVGGRGGDVYTVRNLNASGAGSFADAVATAPAAGRTIVFAVSGHIRLPSGSGGGLTIDKNKITVAGQTAPGDGICFWNNTMNLAGDDLVIRGIRWRYGKQAAGGDSVSINGAQRIILDHCDVMFSTDENLSSFGTPPEYFTFQWSINAWGLQTHSCGGLWDVDHATAHHTLWANNHTRNPKCIAPSVMDWVNNIVFGWNIGFNISPGSESTHRVNIRGSTFSHGGSTTFAVYGGAANGDGTNKYKLHIADTALDGNNNGVLDVSRTNYAIIQSGVLYDAVAAPWPLTINGVAGGTAVGAPVSIDSRLTAYKKVLSKVGAVRMEYDPSRPLRDEITQLCVTRVANLQRSIISDPLTLGLSTGTAFAALNSTVALPDADQDGMPDAWENALGMNAALASHQIVFSGSSGIITENTFFPPGTPVGYNHLEEYLHFKAQPHAWVPRNTLSSPSFIDVDLSRYTSGFTNSPVFTISGVQGGTFTQSGAGGKLVRFVPALDSSGRAKFDFTVIDAEGSAWTQTFNLLITITALPRDLVWVGNGTTNPWDLSTTVWKRSGSATAFNNGDSVSFDHTGSASPALTLSGTLQPGVVLVDGPQNYLWQGPGIIGGAASLTKRGTGTLTLRSNHTYTGATVIEEGSIVLGALGVNNNNSGTLGTGPLSLLGNATLVNAWRGSSQQVVAAPIEVPAGASPSIYSSERLRLSGPLTGSGVLTVVNQGNAERVDFAGAWNGFNGKLSLVYAGSNAGVRLIFNGGSFNGLAGASVDLGGNAFRPVTNSGGNTCAIGALNSDLASAVLGGGTAGPVNYTIGGLNLPSTFAGRIEGNAQLTKVGTETLTLTGASTHTGATTVNAGRLRVNGSFSTSAVSVANGASLGGSGTVGGNVNLASGAILDPEGVFTTGALVMNQPVLHFALSATPTGSNDRLQAASLQLSGAQTFVFQLKDAVLGAGTYPLLQATGALTASSVTLSHNLQNTPRQTFSLHRSASGSSPGSVWLSVTGVPVTLAWSGAQTQWDVGGTQSWLNGAASDVFYDADAVSFTDAASLGSVNIAAAVSPRSILVDNTSARPFSIAGASIIGSAALTKQGTGTLTLHAANSYSGGVFLQNGVLALGSGAANAGGLGTGVVQLDGGVLRMFNAGNDTHAGTLPNNLHVAGNARFEVANRCGFSGNVTGSGILEYRTNYVRADVTGDWSAFTGQVQVTTGGYGEFRVAASYAWPGLPNARLHLAAGTHFYMSGTLSAGTGLMIRIGGLSGASGSSLRGGSTAGRALTYRLGGKGTNEVFHGSISEQNGGTTTHLIKEGVGDWSLGGHVAHRGSTVVEEGTLTILSGGSIINAAALDVRAGSSLRVNGGAVSVDELTILDGAVFSSTGGSITAEVTNHGTATVSAGTLVVNGDFTNHGTMRVTSGAQITVSGVFQNTGVLDLLTSASSLPAGFINTGVVIENSDRRILSASRNGTNFTATVQGYTGHSYQLQRAETLAGPWTNVGIAQAGTGGLLHLTDNGGAVGGQKFYRIHVAP